MAPPSIPTVLACSMYVRLLLLHLPFLLHFGGGVKRAALDPRIYRPLRRIARALGNTIHHHSPRGPRAFEEEEEEIRVVLAASPPHMAREPQAAGGARG